MMSDDRHECGEEEENILYGSRATSTGLDFKTLNGGSLNLPFQATTPSSPDHDGNFSYALRSISS